MKKIVYYFSMALLLLTSNACTKFDNYEEPKETIKGVVIDKNTQKPVQTEVGEGGVRIKLMEYSWSESPTPYYFGGMQEGDFKNERSLPVNMVLLLWELSFRFLKKYIR